MAQRRMFSQRIINSAKFIKMPHESQALYFHLCMNADDDGIVEAFSVMRMTGSAEDNFRVLVAKQFVVPLNEEDVSYILDWNEHNLIRADRKIDSMYKDLLVQVLPQIDVKEPKPRADTGKITGGRPVDAKWTAQVRLGKDRLGEVRLGKVSKVKDNNTSELSSQVKEIFNIFYKINPSINWGNKTSRSSAEFLIKKFGFDNTKKMAEQIVSVQGQPYCPTATTPYQMKEKLANFKIYFDNQKNNNKSVTFIS